MAPKAFFSKIAGVSFDNADGSSRQALLARCTVGERLRLVREAENPHDDEAVAVYRAGGGQLGYITERANDDVAVWLDDDVRVLAFVAQLTGGGPDEHLGANVLIVAALEDEPDEELDAYARARIAQELPRRPAAASAAAAARESLARAPEYPRPEERLVVGAARVAEILAAPPDHSTPEKEQRAMGEFDRFIEANRTDLARGTATRPAPSRPEKTNRRRVAATALGIAALAAGYLYASPYLTIWRVQAAAQRGDADTVADHVDFPAVRDSLKAWMAVAMAKHMDTPQMKDNPFAALGVVLAASMTDRLVDAMVNPEALRVMLAEGRRPSPTQQRADAPAPTAPASTRQRYETFNRFVVESLDSQFAMVWERRGLSWTLVRLRMPTPNA